MHFHKQAFPFPWIIISEIIGLNLLVFFAIGFWKTNPIAGKSDTDELFCRKITLKRCRFLPSLTELYKA